MLLETPQPFNVACRVGELAALRPDATAIVTVGANGDTRHDYADLDRRARRIAALFQQRGAAGERALLLADSGIDYVAAFFGCLYAGVIAVPVYAPESAREQHLARLRGIAGNCDARFVLTTSDIEAKSAEALTSIAPGAQVVAIDRVCAEACADTALNAAAIVPVTTGGDDLAFLQYTSGSTSAPKGVMVSHANILANEIAIQASLGVTADDVFVSWLPLYHDMGLIGALLQSIHSGIPLVLMSPQWFLERPVRWLDAISRYRGTISGGPDFSYRLCCERVRDTQMSGLDLSSWRVAFCGSEPVRHDTQEAFVERFVPARFDAGALYPCYGLAETTLFVTGGTRGGGLVTEAFSEAGLRAARAVPEAEGVRLVQCGRHAAAHDVRIVDPDTRATLPEGRSGEIWVSGPSVALGYWQNAAATADAFVEDHGARWLRTGDLGFQHDGGLYVVGRRKDMIIVRGQNLYPQDIERVVEAEVEVVRKGRVAAFGVELDGREGIGIALEVSRSTQKLVPPQALVDALNEAVGMACGEPLAVAVLLNPGALPKTSSGKLQRSATAQRWKSRELDAYAIHEGGRFVEGMGARIEAAGEALSGDVEPLLAGIWSEVLERPVTEASAHFISLGGNSLRATQLVARMRERWQVRFDLADVFDAPELRRMAALASERLASGERFDIDVIRSDSEDTGRFAASSGQQRLWFLWQLDRASSAYHMAGGLDVRGALDIAALCSALDALVQHHGALRTTFAEDGEHGVAQIVHSAQPVTLEEIDARSDFVHVDEHLRKFAGVPFDLAGGPLWRAALVRVADDAYRIVLAMHHIVADGWSVDLLLDELARRYGAAVRGEAQAFAAQPLRYADYANWQRRWIESPAKAQQLAYWRERLVPAHVPLVLPVDRPRTSASDHPAAHHPFAVPDALREALRHVEREHRLTFFTVSMAAFALALHAYTGECDIRIGVPFAGRTRSEVRELIGFFVNTQVVRCRIDRSAPLHRLIRETRGAVLGAQDNQELPFNLLVDALRPERGMGSTPLFDVMYGHQPAIDGVAQAMAGVATTRFRIGDQRVPFELTLDTYEAPDGRMTGTFTYAAELFDAQTIDRIVERYLALLGSIAADAGRSTADALAAADTQRDCLLSWSGNPDPYDDIEPVMRALERRAASDPQSVAVIDGAREVSYEALNARSNRLAHRLLQIGVGPDVRVGISVERSVDMVVGLLAILKAGGAYVPLDPAYPRERLSYMLEDSCVSLLLTQSHVRERIPASDVLPVVEIDRIDLSGEPASNPNVAVHPQSLAYVIYTSGSTGKPKGVAISHHALAIHTQATLDFCALNAADRVLQFATFSFDGFVEEIYPTLAVGAAMVLRGPDLWDSETLYRKLHEHRISIIDVTTAYWHLLAQDFAAAGPRDYGALRIAIAGGEAMALEGVKAWRAAGLGHVTLLNTYGPTETTVSSTLFDCTPLVMADACDGRVPIGRPLAGRRVYVLDAALNLAPAGVAGELYIGGAGVARGYLNRAALSAERFVPDPFDAKGGRLYRTGDLVRWNAAGELEYLGRIDHQVKIRGFRIELGEVEAQLLAQPEVREAVVTAQEGAGGARLVGYVTAHAGHTLEPQTLRASLASSLPEYMVPGVIVVLEALPLTPNGKIDRNALPAPEYQAHGYEAPQGGTEETLARVWCEVLGVERVGRHDNFFELGGDSILSLKVVARAHESGLRIAPRQVFDAQTVAALAVALATAQDDGVPPLRPLPADERQALPLSHAQQRLWFLWNLQRGSSAYHMAGAQRLRGGLDAPAVRASFGALVSRHESLRTTFAAAPDGQATQTIHANGHFDWREIDAGTQQNVEETSASLATEPFDLTTGPLLRVGLLRLRADEHVLVVSMHHIVSDGWSVDVLLREFVAGYRARVTGEAPDLPPLPLQYADYAVWQRRWLEAGERERQLAYWRETLGEEQPVLVLPADHPRQAVANYHAAAWELDLPAKLGEAVHRTARAHGTTPFVVLLSAYAVLLHRYSGQPDIRVGVPVANRDRVETAGLIGLFVNTQVLRTRLEGGTTLAALLGQVKAAARGAQAHQDLPFDVLVEALQPQRSLSHTPLFQVMFNHLRDDERCLETLPGVSVQWESPGAGMAQFELTLTTAEEASGALSASLVYARELFDGRTMAQFGRHYVAVLEALTGGDVGTVAEVALLSAQERAGLVAQGARTEQYADVMPVHERIAREAQAHPERVAVVYGEAQLRYGELDEQANRLAQRLAKLGVGPEVRVGIAVERSVEMVVGLLAILKAGGAYVPMDPEYPRDRLAYMLEDSGVALLLTQSWVRERLPVAEGVTVLELDTLDVSAEPAVSPQVSVHGENLAYVIYTSGSTGRPKGAQLTHRNVSRLLTATHPWFDFDASDVWTMFHSYAFDFSVWEIFGALCHGGKLVVVPYLVSRSPEEFAQLLRRERVTVLNQTPSAFRQLMQVPQMSEPDLPLRTVIFGGEALDPQTLASWVQRFGDAKPRLVNMYGITETTVHVTYRPVREADTQAQRSPVGRAIPDLGLYVLDLDGNLAPVGVAGELYVSGAGLARGYLNRPALSAERFVPDPFDANGGRLYRTGDLARWTQDGELEYLGRIDHQVKVRGFRIELGEIEAQLLALHDVREAVVLPQEGPGGARLVAYVTARADHAIEPQALRASLGDALPDYMVPAVVMVLDTLPLTSNGKVDRKALPAPEYAARGYEAPQGETETALAQIWSEVLGIEQVSRTDNFFELGGDSILSLQIVARARQAGWQVSARQLFERQTVALLAAVAQRAQMPETVDDEAGEVPLLPIQQMFFEQAIPNRHHWNQAVLLESREVLDTEALETALCAVISHHGALRLRFNQDGEGKWHQTYTDAQPSEVLWACEVTGTDDIEARCNEAHRSLNIETGPVLRAVSMKVADGTSRLLLVIHHLVVDGVSWRVLLEDLQTAYAQARSGEKPVLPARSASYRRWSQAVGKHAQTLGGELDYWQEVLRTPADIPVAEHGSASESQHAIGLELTREQTRALLHDAPSAYRTQINDLLLTALGRALCAWSGRESIRIDVEGHGREDIEQGLDVSRTVGWFTSVYPVKLEPVGELGDAICRVKESLRAVPGRGLGYGLLRYLGDAHVKQALASQQPSQVVFNYLGQFDEALSSRTGTDWRLVEAGVGEMQDPAAKPAHALSIDGGVYADRLKLTISDAGARYPADVIERLAAAFRRELEQIVEHCAQAAPRATPSDFPLAQLTQAQLDAWPVPLADVRDIYPVSATQNGMLFHSLHTPGAYVNQVRVDVDDLDAARFAQAWRAVGSAEDMLRTGFRQIDGAWLQWVGSNAQLAMRELDWCGESQIAAKLDLLADDDRTAGIDVTRAPLMRLTVVRTGEHRHHLVWTHHHVLLDGWSVSQLLGEVLRHYAGESLPAQGGRYRDYIAWLQQRDKKADEAYWREQLAKLDGSTWLANALPVEESRQKASGYSEYRVTLDAMLTQRLEHLAREERVTVNTVIQAAWAVILQRYTGQRAVVFGATVSGRPTDLAGSQQLLGLFINTLPVVLAPRAEQTVGDWLREVQAQGLSMREHEHTPLNEIQRWAGAGGRGLFDTLVVYENYPVDAAFKEAAPAGLKFGEIASREETNYPLTITVMPAEKLRIDWTFAREHFGDEHVAALIERFERVLRQIGDDCGRAVGSLVIESPDEAAVLLAKGTCNEAYVDVMPVHERVAREVQAHPERVAVVYGETQLRYGELDAQANRLAQRLAKLGVGPEVRVGIAVERSVEMVVGLLAILKAGGAYVPLDPEYPRDRLAYMLEDSGVALLLTQSWVRERLPVAEGVTVLELDTLDVSAEPAVAPQISVHGDNLAYVIYTSGSTGRPKGAANRHSALSNRLAWMQSAYALEETDVVLQKTPFSFDVSVWEFFWPLMTGARLVVAEPGAHRDPQRLVELIRDHGVTTLHFVPSMLQAFVAHEGVNTCRKLKRIVCSGEALPADLANRTLEQLPGVGLYNLYGPTEAAIDVTHWTCRTGDEVVPIGRPIGNVSTHVLDAQMNLVPQGVAGELYLGGMGLARGYLNRATLTAERFVPDPFDANGGRLYRTGDLARWTNEGALEYLGRIDHQVKVRGLRIELGEIEAQLVAQAEVREAVVTAQEGPGGTRLIAYVTAHADHTVEQQALREALLRQLPDYMVPSAIMVLEALPLNPNGKVDRKALPVPEYQTRSYEPPQGETETSLAQIWSEVMGIEQVSRTDNFFELGGDSILIMKVATRIRSMTDFDVPLPMLFSHPTIAELAACISAATKPTAHIEPVPPLVPVARETGALPLSPAQRRVWIASQLAGPGSSAYNVSASVRLEGDISEARVAQALALLVGRQEVLRTSYPDRGGLPHAAISDAANADLVIRDLTAVPVDRHPAILRQIALERIDRPFDLACDALLRATLVRINGRQALLMLSVHHIVCDGWSMGVLVRDFCAFYAAGERAALPALPVQYVDYAAWHARVLDSARGEALKAFWRGELAGARSVLDLPADFPRPPAISDAGDSLHGTLDARLAQQVARFAREQRVTPFVVLLSAFQVLLHRLTGSRDVLVGTDVAGRTRVELEPLIGFFVNVVPLRLAMDDARTRVPVGELVARAHASAVAALEHQDLPFDQIAACAQVKRDAARNPLVQALFVLQNTPAAPIELPGVVAELIDLPASHSKFDMGLFINEGAGDWQVEWVFATALFRHATIQRWLDEWLRLVEDIVTQTEISVMGDAPAAVETTKPTTQAGAADKFAKLKKIASRGPRPAADARQAEGPARLSLLQPGRVMPVVLEPHSADVDPLAWAAQHRAFIEATLARHAVILFRNFRLPTPQAFEAFAEAMCPGLYGSYGDLPKKEGGKKTYRSTPYPEREMILYHNESAHLEQWPRKQWFFCELPSRVGGATPIVDCREMLRELPSEIVERFASAGLMYIRTFTDRLDVSWRDFFGTDERTEVERRLQVAGTAFNWLDNDGLQTRTLCPGVITHPVTGERCFFNQVQLHHPYFLKPEIHRDLLDMVGADYLPRNVCYGDGTAIDDTTMARIGEAYERCAVRFEWRKGDVVMLDNMLAAHARDPYEEPRKIVVAMGEMVSRASVADADAQRLEGADATRQE